MSQLIKLRSTDKDVFHVQYRTISCSKTLKKFIDEHPNNNLPILVDVSTQVLTKIIVWARYHKYDPAPLSGVSRRTDIISKFDLRFLRVGQTFLFKLMVAANYLEIDGLKKLIGKTIANMLKGRCVEEMRELLMVSNDYSPSQLAEVVKLTSCFDKP